MSNEPTALHQQHRHATVENTTGMPQQCVWFVGAGPGVADLLTVRAMRLLEAADAVLYDVLVPLHLLGTLRPEVEQIPVCRDDPSTGRRFVDPGRAVGSLLVKLATEGRRVVRLKGGDPSVFARFAEEVLPLQEAGIRYEIVPGVTAATAAAAAIAAPLTSRTEASSVTLITGHRAVDKGPVEASDDDFARLATLPGTLVVYMGLEKIDCWTESLIAAGRHEETPVAVVSRCSWPDERRCTTTLAGLRSSTSIRSWPSPAVIIVGDVLTSSGHKAAAAPARQPLAGQQVLVTRPASQAVEVLRLLTTAGAHGLCIPTVEIVPPPSWQPLDEAIQQASTYDWIIFSSSNGVEAFAARLAAAGDARLLGTARLAAVGPRTADALAAHRLACDLVPATHSAAGLVEALADESPRRRILLIQADRGRDTLENELTARSHDVCRVMAYISRDVPTLNTAAEAVVSRQPIDWVMLSSPAITAAAIRLFGDRLRHWKTACNSEAAANLLAAHGVQATVTSRSPSMAAVVEAMEAWEAARESHTGGG